jgi:hypothetical protein
MPARFEQVISSFLTWSVYKEFAMSATWHYFPSVGVLMLGPALNCLSCLTLRYPCTDIHNLHAYIFFHAHTNIQFQHFITDKTQSQFICLVFRECINLTRTKHVSFPNFSISKLRNISRLRHRLVPVQCGCSFKPYSTLNFHNILKNTQRAKKLSWLKTWIRNMFRFRVYLTKHETENI